MYGCMYPGLYDTMTDTVNSIILDISVAMAAPRTFIAGIPNPPNISTALSTIYCGRTDNCCGSGVFTRLHNNKITL